MLQEIQNQIIWTEKYRPQTIEQCILPFKLKQQFQGWVDAGVIDSNVIFSGPPGMGKTTVAKALMNELKAEYIFINTSLNGNIDTLRNEVYNFASRMSLDGGRKYVIWDEAERMTAVAQDGIRGFIEEFSSSCGFIFTCNTKSMLSTAISSRAEQIDFSVTKGERTNLMKSYYKRLTEILKAEGVEYDAQAIVSYMGKMKNSLDFRNILIHMQNVSKIGKITEETLINQTEESFVELVGYLKEKSFNKMRQWVSDNPEYNAHDLFRKFYDAASEFMEPASVALLVILISKYQYQAAFVADLEINLAAFLTEVMVDCSFV